MRFPNTPSFTGPMTPERIEADIADLEVDGEVPSGIGLHGNWVDGGQLGAVAPN